jgi:hypothetical protein
MTYKHIRRLACDYGIRLQCKFSSTWIDNKIAGIEWFMKRHRNLMLRKPKNTSLFRANAAYQTAFTVKNTMTAFAKPGIWPFSRLVFSDEDFGPSSITPMEKL